MKTTRRKSVKRRLRAKPSAAQLRARRAFAAAAKRRRNKTVIVKPKRVLVVNGKKRRSVKRQAKSTSGRSRQRNPRYFLTGIDPRGREHDLAVRVAVNKTQAVQWAKKAYPAYTKITASLVDKADYIGRGGMIKIKRPRRRANPQYTVEAIPKYTSTVKETVGALTRGSAVRKVRRTVPGPKSIYRYKVEKNGRRRNSARVSPKVKQIRQTFAGSVKKVASMSAPDGTPRSLAKLGKLVSIKTDGGTIKPATGTTWLCADAKGKLHLATTAAQLHNGPAHNFGHVNQVEYEEQKPHLGYPKKTIWFHKMGEETGRKPTLVADGKGGLKFRGGDYRITREGIVN